LGSGHVAIALATSIAGWLNVILLWRVLRHRENFSLDHDCIHHVSRMFLAAGAMAIVLLLCMNIMGNVFTGDNELLRLLALGAICGLGGTIYIILCFRMGALKWSDVKSFLKPVKKDPDMQMGNET
jgi:putative peptidoglycan lipid II flippase